MAPRPGTGASPYCSRHKVAQPRQCTEKSRIVAFRSCISPGRNRCCKDGPTRSEETPRKEALTMPGALKLDFARFAPAQKGVLVVFTDEKLALGDQTRRILGPAGDLLGRVGRAERFTGKSGTALELVAPAGLKASRLVFAGVGKGKGDLKPYDLVKLGGSAMGRFPAAAEAVVVGDLPGGPMSPAQ